MPTGLAVPGNQGTCRFRAMTYLFASVCFVSIENKSHLFPVCHFTWLCRLGCP